MIDDFDILEEISFQKLLHITDCIGKTVRGIVNTEPNTVVFVFEGFSYLAIRPHVQAGIRACKFNTEDQVRDFYASLRKHQSDPKSKA